MMILVYSMVVKSVLSCLEGNTSKLSQRLRISCIDALLVSDPSMLSSFVLSSGKRLVFALASSPFSYLFCCCFFSNKIRKGKKKIIFHFTVCLPFVTLTTSWGKSLSSLIKTTLFLRLISKTYVDIFESLSEDIWETFLLLLFHSSSDNSNSLGDLLEKTKLKEIETSVCSKD